MLTIEISVSDVFVLLFVCSLANFVDQLPNCKTVTRDLIERIFVEMGYFINFRRNTRILRNKISLLTTRIEELGARTQGMEGRAPAAEEEATEEIKLMVDVQEKAVQLSDETSVIINNHWHRGWSGSCYRLSHRVGEKISRINHVLNPREFGSFEPSTQDGIPGIIVVVLIVYSLTNAILHLPNSKTATRDMIDWIVLEMVYPFKLKANLKILINKMDSLRASVDELPRIIEMLNVNEERNVLKWTELWGSEMVALQEEGMQLSDEAGHMINDHWWRGWCGLRYRLSKRIEELIPKIAIHDLNWLKGPMGSSARDAISSIDNIRDTLPAAITDFRHYLHFNTNVETLRSEIEHLQQQLNKTPDPNLQVSEEEARKWAALLEAAKNEAMQLIQEVELMHKYWYKRLPASRYRLSERVVLLISRVKQVLTPPGN